jgi:AraC-like DNA-binding protein
VQNIRLVTRLAFNRQDYKFAATSLPGHLLHYVVSGRVRQQCNGREYELRPSCVMWYHEDEWVTGRLLEPPWVFYSVNFIAPALPPPPDESRLFPRHHRLAPLFHKLWQTWQQTTTSPLRRQATAHARLLDILAALALPDAQPYHLDPRARLWWELETELRQDLARAIDLPLLVHLSGASAATIARACRHAVGQPPLRRMKQVRLSLARGLVLRSDLAMKEIAARIGYPRVHEFSRDYRKHFGQPPTAERG